MRDARVSLTKCSFSASRGALGVVLVRRPRFRRKEIRTVKRSKQKCPCLVALPEFQESALTLKLSRWLQLAGEEAENSWNPVVRPFPFRRRRPHAMQQARVRRARVPPDHSRRESGRNKIVTLSGPPASRWRRERGLLSRRRQFSLGAQAQTWLQHKHQDHGSPAARPPGGPLPWAPAAP